VDLGINNTHGVSPLILWQAVIDDPVWSMEKVVMMTDTNAICQTELLPVSQSRMTVTAACVQCLGKFLSREEE
jgi:hypothetical protein